MKAWREIDKASKSNTRQEARSYDIRLGLMQLVVTRHLDCAKETDWRISAGGLRRTVTDDCTAEEAKLACLLWARDLLQQDLMDVRAMLGNRKEP